MLKVIEKTKKSEHGFPVEEVAYLVKAILAEGLEIRQISCSVHVGDIVRIMEFTLAEDDIVEPSPLSGGMTQ